MKAYEWSRFGKLLSQMSGMSRFRVPVVFLFLLMLAARPAMGADPKAQATPHVQKGAAAYRDGDYVKALQEFEKAHAIYPSPKLLFNLAQTHRALDRITEAFVEYREFLSKATDASADTRQLAEQAITELRGRIAFVDIDSVPSNAAVSVDGRSFGKTPVEGLPLTPGPHQLAVEVTGFEMYHRRLELAGGKTTVVQADLKRPRSLQSVESPGATANVLPTSASTPEVTSEASLINGADPAKDSGETDSPFYSTWWFWTVVGGVAVAAVGSALLLQGGGERSDCLNIEPCVKAGP